MILLRSMVASTLLFGVPAHADGPLGPAAVRVCSMRNLACAVRDRDGRTVTIWRMGPHGARLPFWTVAVASPRLDVSDDGRTLVEIYPGLNLLDAAAGSETPVLVIHRFRGSPVRVRLRDVISDVANLLRTASHRQWARSYGFDGEGRYHLETVEGRRWGW